LIDALACDRGRRLVPDNAAPAAQLSFWIEL
jgi:hypothetical protein